MGKPLGRSQGFFIDSNGKNIQMTDRPPFLTGSRVYGTPREDSDYDVVIFASPEIKTLLTTLIGEEHNFKKHPRIGQLQLILVDNPDEYDAWVACTEHAKDVAEVCGPLSKENSHDIFSEYFIFHGLKPEKCYGESKASTWKQIRDSLRLERERRNNNG